VDLPENEFATLCESVPDCEFYRGKDSETSKQTLGQIEGIFTEEPLPDELTRQMTSLKWLHVTRGGVSTYLTPTVRDGPIQVTGSKGIHATAFSEYALACIFALAKKIPQCLEAQKQRQWQKVMPMEIEGRTLGVVGLGTVGSTLARKAKALGLRVVATKRSLTPKPEFVDALGPPDFLPQLLSQADFVVICLASVPSTFNLIAEGELRSMKKTAYLINLTGGRIVAEKLLAQALREKWIAGAALDAFPRQPLPADSEFWDLPNVIISPRIGGLTAQKWPLLMPIFIDNLKRFIAGEPLRNVVDKQLGY
jgi:phosphoglycerate dehydrogenase-like enzyme